MTAPFPSSEALPLQRGWLCYLVLGIAIWLTLGPSALSQEVITLETTPYPINLAAGEINTWPKEGLRVFVASGDVWITQGKVLITANNATLWFYEQEALQQKEAKVEVYCEGEVTLVQDKDVQHYGQIFVHLETTAGIVVNPYSGAKVKNFEEEQPLGSYLQALRMREQWKGEFTSREPVVQVGKAPGAVDIVADDIDSWVEGNQRIVSALGNVVLQKDATTMEADNAILWFDEEKSDGKKKHVFKELYAEGNVILKSPEDIRKADKIFQNLIEKKAIYINPWIKTKMPEPPFLPIYLGGKEAKQIDQDHMIVKDAYFTTCNFGHPHYRFNSRNLTITQRKTPVESYSEIVARHDTFRVGELPVAYLPKYTYDTRTKTSFFKGFGASSSGRLGFALTTTWDPLALGVFPELNRWMRTIVKLDYLSKRGPSAGTEIFYKRPNMDGHLETFYVKDHAETDQTTGLPPPQENRGRLLWRHRQHINKEWRADAELSYLSDRAFLREFYEPEFKTGKAQETDLYFRRLQDNEGLTFLAKKQIHSFDTGSEALPQLGYQLISQPLWEDRLNLTSQSSLGYLDFHIDDKMNTKDPTRYQKLKNTTGSSIRMDNNNTLSWPFQFGIMKFRPFVGGRVTAYSKSTEDPRPNSGPPVGRLATSLGMDTSTNFWRIYGTESKLFRINKLKHVITPDLRWEAGPTVTKNADHLLQYDEPSDGLDKYNAFIFGVRNRFQTRRGPPSQLRTVDLLDLDMEVHLLTSPSDGPEGNVTHYVGNAEGYLIPKKHSFLQPDIRAQLTDRLALASERSEFNLDDFRFDFYNVGITFQNSPKWYQFLGYRFIRDTSSTVIANTNLVVKEKWGLSVGETYDFKPHTFTGTTKSARSLATSITLGRRSHDFNSSLYLVFDAVNKNTTFGFNITPVGVKRPVGRAFSFAPTP